MPEKIFRLGIKTKFSNVSYTKNPQNKNIQKVSRQEIVKDITR